MTKHRVLHVLLSDFGASHTAGYRSLQIYNHSKYEVQIYARSQSSISSAIVSTPLPLYRYFSLLVKFLRKTKVLPKWIVRLDNWLFERGARSQICRNDIIHFFNHNFDLIQYAKERGKTCLLEGYTHPNTIIEMHRSGMKVDYPEHLVSPNQVLSYEEVDYIVSPSDWVTESLCKANIPEEKIVLIHYGVHKQADRVEWREDGVVRFMFAGALKVTKGVTDLIDAWEQLPQRSHKHAHLDIYGRSYPTTASLLSSFNRRFSNVTLHGFNSDVGSAYRSNDVYIFPSYLEGSTKTIFEAMSYGLPVITTANSGSIVRDRIDGFIISIEDPQKICAAIRFFIENPDMIAAMGKSSQLASRGYSWGLYAQKVDELYARAGT